MKSLSSFILLFVSCSYYSPYYNITIGGLGDGELIVSNSKNVVRYTLTNGDEQHFEMYKGEVYSLSFYPNFYSELSRFPLGGVVSTPQSYMTLSPHIGPVSEVINTLHSYHIDVEEDITVELMEKFNFQSDVWRYSRADIVSVLTESLELYMLRPKPTLTIEELDEYRGMECDNRLFRDWYTGVFTFYNKYRKERIIVEIYDNGEFCSLIRR